MIGAASATRRGPRSSFMLLLGAVLLYATSMAAQPGNVHPGGGQASQPASDNLSGAGACARCHKDVVKDFDKNPHGNAALKDGSKVVTCESCHGSGSAHAEGGDVASIFNPATATAKQVDEKCQVCHDTHGSFGRSAHGKANVSCVGCHTVHGPGVPKHLLKTDQPQFCFQCHNDVKPQFSMAVHHKVEERLIECTDCHDIHGNLGENTLPSSSWQFMNCTKCHAATSGPFVYEHAAVKTEGCSACHFAHGGPNPKLLTQANVNTICLHCHFPSANSASGLPAVPEHIQSAQSQSCINCHSSIHGSNSSDVFLSPAKGRSNH